MATELDKKLLKMSDKKQKGYSKVIADANTAANDAMFKLSQEHRAKEKAKAKAKAKAKPPKKKK